MLSCGGVTILVYDSTGTTLLYSNASAATLTDGHVTFRLSYALTAGTTYVIKAKVNDLAGNTGTGAGLDQLGDVRVSHALDLDQSDGSAWGARHIERARPDFQTALALFPQSRLFRRKVEDCNLWRRLHGDKRRVVRR